MLTILECFFCVYKILIGAVVHLLVYYLKEYYIIQHSSQHFRNNLMYCVWIWIMFRLKLEIVFLVLELIEYTYENYYKSKLIPSQWVLELWASNFAGIFYYFDYFL